MSLKIGMRSVNITPPAPVSLAGQFRIRVSEGVESPLLANIFAIENGEDQIIICSVELSNVGDELCCDVRRKVAKRCSDIRVDDLIIASTHTHTGPNTAPVRHVGGLDPKYLPYGIRVIPNEVAPPEMWDGDKCREYISTVVSEGICDAWESRDEGYFGAAFGRAVVGHCRRAVYTDGSAKLFGTTQVDNFFELEAGQDTGVELLYAFDKNKKPIGALANVACPAQVVEDMKVISADYWGKVRDWIHRELGEDFVLCGLLSAAGDQNPIDLVRRYRMKNPDNRTYRRSDTFSLENTFAGIYEIGKRLGREIVERLPEAVEVMKGEAVIKNQTLTVDFPLRRVSDEEYESNLLKLRAKIDEFGTSEITPGQASDIYIYAGSIKRYLLQDEAPTFAGKVHVARIDDIAFASNPFELFLNYGNRIRGRSPAAQTFLIQLCDGSFGYLPTEKAERGSHYSAYVSSGWTGHEGGDLLVEKTLDILNKMWDN